ncbi:MAG: Fur family transcriptional regulator, partial [Candidatus Margulisiibacteriota bacterium]
RESKQKRAIIEFLRSTKSHPTADQIYVKLKKQFPKLSLSTVYRNLNILRDQGRILELSFGSTFDRFDATTTPHPHFICQKCNQIYDFDLPPAINLNKVAQNINILEFSLIA